MPSTRFRAIAGESAGLSYILAYRQYDTATGRGMPFNDQHPDRIVMQAMNRTYVLLFSTEAWFGRYCEEVGGDQTSGWRV